MNTKFLSPLTIFHILLSSLSLNKYIHINIYTHIYIYTKIHIHTCTYIIFGFKAFEINLLTF